MKRNKEEEEEKEKEEEEEEEEEEEIGQHFTHPSRKTINIFYL